MTRASLSILVASWLSTACGDTSSTATAPAARPAPAPSTTAAPSPPPPLPPPPSGPRYGDVITTEDEAGEEEACFLLIEAEGVLPRSGQPAGMAFVHGGAWSLSTLEEVESPYAEAWMLGGPSRVPVASARWVRGTFSGHDSVNDRDAMFLGLTFDGCGGGWGVVGVEPRVHPIDPTGLSEASPALAARIRERDASQEPAREDWGFSPPRAFEVPGRDLAFVFGNEAYAIRGDQVAVVGDVMAVIDAPPHLLVTMTSPSEDWLQPVDELPWADDQETSERRQK